MKINVRMFIGDSDIEFKDLDKETKKKYKERITEIYAEQVSNRVVEMINTGKSEQEILNYLCLESSDLKSS